MFGQIPQKENRLHCCAPQELFLYLQHIAQIQIPMLHIQDQTVVGILDTDKEYREVRVVSVSMGTNECLMETGPTDHKILFRLVIRE